MDAHRFDSLAVSRWLRQGHARRRVVGAALGVLGLSGMSAGPGTPTAAAKDCRAITDEKRRKACLRAHRASCAEKNWCVNRNHLCGGTGSNGKCLVTAFGGNVCGEILFQARGCDECAAPGCVGCRCALAAGGGDRCNNGTTGFDFICVRPV